MAIIKQICFDNDTGRLIISDSENKHFLCDMYGRKKISFFPYISGSINGDQRIKQHLMNPLTSMAEFKTESSYLPSIKKFEGYSKFPRPLVPPFANTPEYELSSFAKQSLISALKKYFTIDKAHHFLNLSNENNGIDYFTCDLNQYDSVKEDTASLLKLIEDTFEEYRQTFKYKLNVMHKAPIIKALIHFKQVILDNRDMKIVNGRRLNEAGEKIKELNSCVTRIISRKGLVKRRNLAHLKTPMDSIRITDVSPIRTTTRGNDLVLQDNEISFLSNESENEKKYREENIVLIKSNENMNKSIEREIKLLTDFFEEPKTEQGILRKYKGRKWKNNGELYFENMKTLQKVNPIAFKLREQKDQYDLKLLMIKKKQSEMTEKTIHKK